MILLICLVIALLITAYEVNLTFQKPIVTHIKCHGPLDDRRTTIKNVKLEDLPKKYQSIIKGINK